MLALKLDKLKTVLCLGAHSDDIEIGCGGTILRLTQANPLLKVHWVVFSGNTQRAKEARASAESFLYLAKSKSIQLENFRDAFFPQQSEQIKETFEKLKSISPDLIMTHRREDAHQDHRVISQLTWNTWRDHLILEYEIPKWDGDLRTPNVYFQLDQRIALRKSNLLMKHFGSQRNKHWFARETFLGLMRLRGIECNAKYAEGFFGYKLAI
jgi:LmbE family N-acetylglucosaminyl deacetylase